MDFVEFAGLLYPIIGGGAATGKFTRTRTMEPGREPQGKGAPGPGEQGHHDSVNQ